MAKKIGKKSLKKRSRSPRKSVGLGLGEHLSQKKFFKKIDFLEKRGDYASMKKRQQMLENILN